VTTERASTPAANVANVANVANQIASKRVAVSTNDADRLAYARDLWPRHLMDLRDGRAPGEKPQAVCWPETTEDVARVVAWCAKEGVPIVPYGAGSGVCGGVLPDARTVVVDLKKMARWRSLDEGVPALVVESGAMGITLEEDLQRKGWTIGHFPSSILCSTVGGWIAARGAGQCSGYYGKIEDMVVELELVDGRGEVVTCKRRTSAPDLVPLVVGSEGTLGVITSATMRLHRASRARACASFAFDTTERGWEGMRALFQAGLRPAVARLYDPFDAMIARMGSVKAAPSGGAAAKSKVREIGAGGKFLRQILKAPKLLNALVHAGEDIGAGDFRAMVVLVFEGGEDEARDAAERARAICVGLRGEDLGEGPAHRWLLHRYAVSYRQPPTIRTGAFLDTMEVAAPWSRLGALYDDVRRALGRHVFVMAHLSHAYPDGCSIYFTFAGSADGERACQEKYDRAWRDAIDAAIDAGGTLSHHHGVGRSKAPRLGRELGLGVEVVRRLQAAFDPRSILNPGNLLPRETPAYVAPPAPPASPKLDEASLLVHAAADATLASIESMAKTVGATLGIDRATLDLERATLGAWIDAGCPGAIDRWVDPVDHAIAGLDARIKDGRVLSIRACPRRAVGPDLTALVVGAHGRFATPLSAHVRVHRSRALHPSTNAVRLDRDPPLGSGESTLLDAIERAL
jgi:alkyldihydroxyacetonephosphate synthase